MKERKACTSCLLLSNSHIETCIRCGCKEFSTIDDFVDQDCLNNENLRVIEYLECVVCKIKADTKKFTKDWERLWSSDKDMDLDIISEFDQVDYTYWLKVD